MLEQSNTPAYSPRVGSKVADALQALADGPMNSDALGKIMRSPSNSVGQILKLAIESDHVVKVENEAGQLHYALSEMRLGEGWKAYHGRQAGAPDPADPFGQLARSRARERTDSATGVRPSRAEATRIANAIGDALGLPGKLDVHEVPQLVATEERFEAAVFSTGDLLISVGANSIRLTPAHQLQLDAFRGHFAQRPVRQAPRDQVRLAALRVRYVCTQCGARRAASYFGDQTKICTPCKESAK